jgi:NAD(P)-dependent dehydrogenase (short-subunit alcohol dehydrogenase family)
MGRWTTADIPDQANRTVLITGANSGLGLRSAEALAAKGALVLMACRNGVKAAAAWDQVVAEATAAEPVVLQLDLADLASVRACADEVNETVEGLDVLMNNAGLMAVPLARTADGFEMQFGTNHLGHFALTGLLMSVLTKAEAPRVVTMSSVMHRGRRMQWEDLNAEKTRYHRWQAYGQSKLANLLFMRELDRRAKKAGIGLTSVAAHPGYAATNLQSHPASWLERRVIALGNTLVAQSDVMGALPQLYAATAPDVQGGEYYGPHGLFESRGHPERVGSSATSRDPETAQRLWAVSEELTGVTYDL